MMRESGRRSSSPAEVANVCGPEHLATVFDLSGRRMVLVPDVRHPVLVAIAPDSKSTAEDKRSDYQHLRWNQHE
jgi:hypothetical protein